ncbi:unnamed protein product [Brugia pahangi]|uniref:Uncharacterized protein n=1 Tax=Brugia pahangi TaxID=6280 RepID=A0A0N4TXZ0_BRUPA|nr:unnamed protein product [Brugia pahangi]
MCVTFIYLNDKAVDDPKSYQLIVLNNRDELFDRPTLSPTWKDGRDQADPYGGTWLGMSRDGRLGNVLAVLENATDEIPCKIVYEYLKSEMPPEDYVAEQLSKEAQQYNGFNVILLHRLFNEEIERKTYFGVQFSNRQGSPTAAFGPGIYGFGNSVLGKPFKKITYGLRLFEEKLKILDDENVNEQELMKQFLDILIDQTSNYLKAQQANTQKENIISLFFSHYPDEQLISQKKQDKDRCKLMSQLFYEFPEPLRYGTRCHTIVLVNGVGRCTYFERSRKQITPHNPDAKYKLILLNNRDELLNRPTSTARWENGILAGRDERESIRGTWLCMNAIGSISNLLAITVPIHQMKSSSLTVTRGQILLSVYYVIYSILYNLILDYNGALPVDFVKSNKKPEEFCKLLINTVNRYNAFQILCFQRNEYDQYEVAGLTYQPDDKIEVTRYPPGIHGFSNSPSCEPFKKVQRDPRMFCRCYPDDQLKRRCGRSSELCKYRAAIFVRYPDGIPYGTRSHTIIIVDRNNRATYYEKSMETGAGKASEATWSERIFHFELI